jgi:hypothetical protein
VPEPNDLFGAPEPAAPPEPDTNRPLADRLRPATLAEAVGEDHLFGPDGALARMLQRGSLGSLILWGPPGVGKTTIARLLAAQAKRAFVQLAAEFSGVTELKRAFADAIKRRPAGQGILLSRRAGIYCKDREEPYNLCCPTFQDRNRINIDIPAGYNWPASNPCARLSTV